MESSYFDWAHSWLKKEKMSFIKNEFIRGQGTQMPVYNPSNEQLLCTFNEVSQDELNHAVASASEAFHNKSFRNKSIRERMVLLKQIGKLIHDHQEQFATLESLCNGKTFKESLEDIPDCSYVFEYYAGWIDKLYGETCPVNPGFLNYTIKEPLGVVAAIVPWNFPLLLATWKIAPALAMGNSIVVKPSEHTPLTLIYLCELIHKHLDMPAGLLNCVLGGSSIGKYMSGHQGVHKITFTGSTIVGKHIVQNAGASNLKQVSLELGGKSPCIFFDDIEDIHRVSKQVFRAMFSHKGEKCSEPTRFIIHEKIFDNMASVLIKMAEETILGDPFSVATQGAQCHKDHFNSIVRYIEEGKKSGALLLTGGHVDEKQKKGYFIKPTIFKVDDPSLSIVQEEIFGPVLVLEPFNTHEDAITRANQTKYGLAAGIYTNNISRAHQIANELDAGMVYINRYGCYEFSSPFGGFKQSGWGKEMAIHSLASYTKTKSIWVSCESKTL